MSIKGSCLCGVVTFEVTAAFAHFFICHCRHCQKDTGSAFAANLFVKTSAFNWLSGSEQVKQFRLAPTRHVKSFCTECGSAVPSVSASEEMCVVPAGSLDVPVGMQPDAHIYKASQANWEPALENIKCFAGLPE